MTGAVPLAIFNGCAVQAGTTINRRGFLSVADGLMVAKFAEVPAGVFTDFAQRTVAGNNAFRFLWLLCQ